MARRPRIFAPGLLYHVIVRGNHREKVFATDRDRGVYLERLGKYRFRHKVEIYAYCLMANHVHLLVETLGPPLSRFMQGVQQSYTQYFNRKYEKVGHLFQGRYKAIVCESDEYLLNLVCYIHLNPVRAGMVQRVEEYVYSSHGTYLTGTATEVVNPTTVLGLLGGRQAYQRFMWDSEGEGHKDEYYGQNEPRILGTPEFVERVTEEVKEPVRPMCDVPLTRGVELLASFIDVDVTLLRGFDRGWELSRERTVVFYVLTRRLGFGVKEVANQFGRTPGTVSSSISRFVDKALRQPALSRKVDRLVDEFLNRVRVVSQTRNG